jgi:molybdopterin/thiamine biosynthesis adenylyltransferase
MDSTLDALLHRTGPDLGSRPLFFRLPADREKLIELFDRTPDIEVHDRMEAQLRELVKLLDPGLKWTEELLQDRISDHLGGRELNDYGVWVYYPWSRRLVHLLDKEEFALVRTDRNRNKITREEQSRLSELKVGVIGLSVGQSVSMTMALERSFGEIRLADFDTLDLSNLNRIRTGTHHLGVNKVVITAREIAELDPYLKVTCFPEGLTKENMDAFFTQGGNLDILVEECDSVDIKILARQKAKALRIPVVMDTSDRGLIDVERFDMEPGRPIMHGSLDHLDLSVAQGEMTPVQKLDYIMTMVDRESLSDRMKLSLPEIGHSIMTWPQLGGHVLIGGAVVGEICRKIFLKDMDWSGRWYIDLDRLLALESSALHGTIGIGKAAIHP